ncbi:MAG TPA: hypothetical protein VMZ66_03550 [Aeromicrobium sp.]|nr:hypothetical protein [Aeromicrobium sp.]
MARQDPQFDAGTGRTGVTRRPLPTGNKSSTAHLDRIAFVAIGGLGLVVLLVISGTFSPPPVVESPGPTATAAATATEVAVLPTFSAEPPASPDPTPTFSPALTPSPPTPSPTPSPSPSPTLSSSPSPSPTPTPTSPLIPSPSPLGTVGPVVPETGLLIVEPADGSTTFEDVVIVRGLAAPGSEITRDVPFWFDEHTTADSVGRWSFVLSLNTGANSFTFRVGDDRATDRTLTINHIAS